MNTTEKKLDKSHFADFVREYFYGDVISRLVLYLIIVTLIKTLFFHQTTKDIENFTTIFERLISLDLISCYPFAAMS